MKKKPLSLLKKIAISLAFLVGFGIVGVLSLSLVFCIPDSFIRAHITESAASFDSSKSWTEDGGYPSTYVDYLTDARMLEIASFDKSNENPVNQALMNNFYIAIDDTTNTISPTQVIEFKAKELGFEEPGFHFDVFSYQRYWHGYLLYLRPLLTVLDYNGVCLLLNMLLVACVAAVVFLCARRGYEYLFAPLLLAILFTSPGLKLGLSLSAVLIIMFVGLIVLLYDIDRVRSKIWLYFLVMGAATAFFDFLTYPLLTLLMPLIVLCAVNPKDGKATVLQILVPAFGFWLLGYAGMWAEKIMIGTIVYGKDFLGGLDEIITQKFRTNYIAEYSRIDAVMINLDHYLTRPNLIFGGILFIIFFIICCCLKKPLFNWRLNHVSILSLLMLSIVPLVWFYVMSMHAYTHHVLEFRLLCSSVFVVGILLEYGIMRAACSVKCLVDSKR